MKFLLIDTATPICRIICIVDGQRHEYNWEAGRTLAKHLLGYIEKALAGVGLDYGELDGLGVFRGPGSFTGLRIGMTVMNTVAAARRLPIVGEIGEDWVGAAIDRLCRGENDGIALPEYGAAARITAPRK